MSWIPCGEPCQHQEDGYCTLDETSKLPEQPVSGISGCIFFLPRQGKEPDSFVNNPEGF